MSHPLANGSLANGSRRRVGISTPKYRIVVGFDPETFYEIRKLAEKRKLSFAEAVRQLVEFGLEDIRNERNI